MAVQVGITVLQRLGVDPRRIRREAEEAVRDDTDVVSTACKANLSLMAQKACAYAADEARQMGGNCVGTGNILPGPPVHLGNSPEKLLPDSVPPFPRRCCRPLHPPQCVRASRM